jgi:hypothetical protein
MEEKKKFNSVDYVLIGIVGPFVVLIAVVALPFYWLGKAIVKWTGVEK